MVRIKIRRTDWTEGDKYAKFAIVPEGMNGFSVIGDVNHKVMIVIEAELDGYSVHNALGDRVFVVVVRGSNKNPDNFVDYCAKRVPTLLISYDNDDAGREMFKKWKSTN